MGRMRLKGDGGEAESRWLMSLKARWVWVRGEVGR